MKNLYKFSNTVLIIMVVSNFAWINESLEIKQVNVLFRHGDRTPINSYPLLPYTKEHYYPAGFGALTNKGKKRSYEFGEVLRRMYDEFLGSTYFPENVEAVSTDYDRTKMSLQLVLAGLYPPNSQQTWNTNLNWQPIPTHYKPVSEDYLFTPTRDCQLYRDEQKRIIKSPKVAEKLSSFDNLLKNMSRLTGKNITSYNNLAGLYTDIECLVEMKFNLPDWVYEVYPKGQLLDVLLTATDILNYEGLSRRLHGGKFIRKMVENMLLVTERENKLSVTESQRIFLYSGHDINIGALLSALNLTELQVSKFTSAVILELLHINNNYYVKIRYYLGIPPIAEEVYIPNCQSPCPFEVFRNLTKNVFPSDEEYKCV